ncbi:autotransporter domain-containing protein [Castellaniella ginsengisoli]|uniref:autotransporter domain-containing protein n=1 Tax=Castellaniella ginsengisoli TaxID=546114 RepID=UPI0031D4FC96
MKFRVFCLAALPCFSVSAQSLENLGSLTANQQGSSYARAVSADGSTVVGEADYDRTAGGTNLHAFRWTSAGGMQDLGDFTANQQGYSRAYAVSADGSTVVGEASYDLTAGGTRSHAFRWTSAGGMQDLGDFTANQQGYSYARAVSADGSTVVGEAAYDLTAGGTRAHAFRWTSAGGMQDLGDFTANQQGYSTARAVSADGSTVVGYANYDLLAGGTRYHAFRWTSAGGMQDLGDLTANQQGYSYARAVSADGSTVVGEADYDRTAGGTRYHAFRWTSAGGMQDLGDFTANQQGYSYARAVSADGSTVVGEASYDLTAGGTRYHAFRWTSAGGMQDLGDFTANQQGSSYATAVSADGSTVVGYASNDAGASRAFIYKAPQSPTDPNLPIQDYENVLKSFPKLAADKELAAAQQQLGMQRLLTSQCTVGQAEQSCLVVSGSFDTAGSDGPIGRRQQTAGIATLGRGLDERWTVGASLSLAHSSLHHNAVNPKNAYGVSGWVNYSEHGLSGLGWQMDAAIGYAKNKSTITRGQGLEHVHLVQGTSNLDTVAARIALGFGIQQRHGWTLTPAVSVTQQNSKFAAYSESPSAFTASYDKSELKTTVLGVDLSAKKSLSDKSQLRLAVGVEQDLKTDRMKLAGVSDVPGVQRFNLESALERKKLRPYASVGYRHQVSAQGAVFVNAGVMRDTFSNKPNVGVQVGYSARF